MMSIGQFGGGGMERGQQPRRGLVGREQAHDRVRIVSLADARANAVGHEARPQLAGNGNHAVNHGPSPCTAADPYFRGDGSAALRERKSVGKGKSVSGSVDSCGRRMIKKKNKSTYTNKKRQQS